MSCNDPTPAPPRLVELRKKYAPAALMVLAAMAGKDLESGSLSGTDGFITIGIRMGIKESRYMEKHALECGCKIAPDAYFQMLEQLAPDMRTFVEGTGLPLPPVAQDPLESGDFWMALCDHASQFALYMTREARKAGGSMMLKAMSLIAMANIAEGIFSDDDH